MKFRKLNNNKYVLRIDRGEKLVESIKNFSEEENINSAIINGIGAASEVKIGYFNINSQEYFENIFKGNYEITSILGNVTSVNNENCLHVHINISDKECNVIGGHLIEAVIGVTCEVFIEVIEENITKVKDNEMGINILNL